MDGPLWGSDVRLARVLASTIPSGDASVVRLRLELMDLINITEQILNCRRIVPRKSLMAAALNDPGQHSVFT